MRAWRNWETRHAWILADQDSTLTGISGAFCAAFTFPILDAFTVSELGPAPPSAVRRRDTPQAIASSIGFVPFCSIVGRPFLDSYPLPPYEFAIGDMATAVGLRVLAAIVTVAFVVVIRVANRVSGLIRNRYASGLVGGGGGGLVSFAFPLTLGAGQSQLGTVIHDPVGPTSASASVRRMMSSTRRCRYQRRPVPARRQDDGRNNARRSRAHRLPRPDQRSRYAGLVYFASGGIEA